MSYEKGFLSTQDHAVGMQCVDRAVGNQQALFFTYLDTNHAVGTGYNDPFMSPGRHDDVLIARTVADFYIDTTLVTPQAFVLVGGPMLFSGAVRVDTGQWKIYVTTQAIFGAKATIRGASAGVPRDAMCFITMESAGPYVTVSTWNLNGGTLADYDFSLVLWSEAVA